MLKVRTSRCKKDSSIVRLLAVVTETNKSFTISNSTNLPYTAEYQQDIKHTCVIRPKLNDTG